MYKVLIVDDEVFVRMGLKTAVEWKLHGFELIGEASNGVQALEVIGKNQPDIVITDIKMPVMDGIQLIKEISTTYPLIKCIVLSNYDDFKFVKEAMKNGAIDYFLKVTIEAEGLIEVLKGISAKIDKERDSVQDIIELKWKVNENQFVIKNRIFTDLAKSELQEENMYKKINSLGLRLPSLKGFVTLMTVYDYEHIIKSRFTNEFNLFEVTVINLTDEIVNHEFTGEVFEYATGCFAAIVDSEKCISIERIKWFAERMKATMKDYIDVDVSVMYGMQYRNVSDLKKVLLNLNEIKHLGFYEDHGTLIPFDVSHFSSENINELYLNIKKDISIFIKFYDYEKIELEINRFLNVLKEKKYEPSLLKNIIILLFNYINDELIKHGTELNDFTNFNFADKLKSCITFNQLLGICNEGMKQYIQVFIKTKVENYRDEILKAVEFIHKNYNSKIALNDIAKLVSMNKSYFCRLFKKETGESYLDYLIKVRLEKAVELMVESDMRIADIAANVGYNDIFYFNNVFKDYFKESPGEYRKQLRANSSK